MTLNEFRSRRRKREAVLVVGAWFLGLVGVGCFMGLASLALA